MAEILGINFVTKRWNFPRHIKRIPLNPEQIAAYFGLNSESECEKNNDSDISKNDDNNNVSINIKYDETFENIYGKVIATHEEIQVKKIAKAKITNKCFELRRSARIREKEARRQNGDNLCTYHAFQNKTEKKADRKSFIAKNNTFSLARKSIIENKILKPSVSCQLRLGRNTPTLEVIKEESPSINRRGRPKKRILSKAAVLEESSIIIEDSDYDSRSSRGRRRRQYSFYEKLDSVTSNSDAEVLHIENPKIEKPIASTKRKNQRIVANENNNSNLRRSARNKVKTLDSSVNQRPVYKFSGEGPSLIAVTDVTIKRSDRKKYAHYAKFVTE